DNEAYKVVKKVIGIDCDDEVNETVLKLNQKKELEKLGVEKNKNADTSRKRRKEKIVLERVLKLAIAHNQ
ncbi:4687_t:CDS:2, partial [Gigaspora rosea]